MQGLVHKEPHAGRLYKVLVTAKTGSSEVPINRERDTQLWGKLQRHQGLQWGLGSCLRPSGKLRDSEAHGPSRGPPPYLSSLNSLSPSFSSHQLQELDT